MFAAEVDDVSGTTILVISRPADGRQTVVYGTKIASKHANAMILPVWNPEKTRGSILLHNMEDCPDFLKTVTDLCLKAQPMGRNTRGGGDMFQLSSNSRLEVEQVGGYSVSVAPTAADLQRLDRDQLTVRDDALRLVQSPYPKDYSFVVAQFEATGQRGQKKEFHPLAYTAPAPPACVAHVPTMHYHGPSTGSKEEFDHTILVLNPDSAKLSGKIPDRCVEMAWNWQGGLRGQCVQAVPAIVLPNRLDKIARFELKGTYTNADMAIPVQ